VPQQRETNTYDPRKFKLRKGGGIRSRSKKVREGGGEKGGKANFNREEMTQSGPKAKEIRTGVGDVPCLVLAEKGRFLYKQMKGEAVLPRRRAAFGSVRRASCQE